MIEYKKEIKIGSYGKCIEICRYYTPDNLKEMRDAVEEFRKTGKIFGGPPNPICGGPIIAQFYDEILADEYIKFKTKQLNQE